MGASTNKQFLSGADYAGRFRCEFSQDQVKNEPMFFSANLAFAELMGGPITQEFVANLPRPWRDEPVVFDSRVHMLMPGWWPCIPGWHHDDVPRSSDSDGQPDYDNPRYLSKHICGLVNAEICPTEFIRGICKMKPVPDGGLVYRQWNDDVNSQLGQQTVQLETAKSGVFYEFDCQTFHRGTKAIKGGWRWFGRVSRQTDRTKSVTNEIRKQVQVYLEFPMEGW